jgi:hypothetical protein
MKRLLASIVVLLCLTSIAFAAPKKKKKTNSVDNKPEIAFDLESCVDKAIDYRTLMSMNPYDNAGKCFWLGFPMVKQQLLSRSVALIGFAGGQQNIFALMDFGKESVPMGLMSGLVMGMGAYEYETVSGSVNTVHHLRKLDGYLKRTKSQQIEKDARDKKAVVELKEQAKQVEIKEAEYQKAAELAREESEKKRAEEQQLIQQNEQKLAALEASQKEDEAKLVKIKADMECKKQQQTVAKTNSIEAAIGEIRCINGQITELDSKNAHIRYQIIASYDKKLAELNAQLRDEFEKERDFRIKIEKESGLLEAKKQNELAHLAVEADALRKELKRLSEKEYALDASQVQIKLGTYDVVKELFPVVLKNKPCISVVIAMNGSIPLPSQTAKTFKQQFENGLIRPRIEARVNGEVVKAVLINDAENYLLEYARGEFMTNEGHKLMEEEREHLIYTDLRSGLMWTRNGNIGGKQMNWNDAMDWTKNLNYGGYSDWRLPTKEEFEAFPNKEGWKQPSSDWLNLNGFQSVQNDYYWSSTNYASETDHAWLVYKNSGIVNYAQNKGRLFFVWPVRGGK